MKKVFLCVGVFVLMYISYLYGYCLSKPMVNESDWVLAYQHWYETSSLMLQNDTLRNDPGLIEDLKLAESEIDSVYNCQIMQWPVVCDQRDKLSDVIRRYADHHPESDIMNYVSETGITQENLGSWAFAY